MNRRKLFAVLSGLAASVGLVKGNERTISFTRYRKYPMEKSYTYNWTECGIGETDDPEFINKRLPRGGPPINRIWLNGKEVSHLHATKFRTGPDGYITYQVRDENDKIVYLFYDTWNNRRIETNERQPEFQQYRVGEKDKPRYIEEIEMNTLYGHVRWEHL